MPTICALVLTYNRRDLLADCLRAVRAQTRPCERVLVLDNASGDGTPDMLARDWAGRVEAHSLPRNLGAAGGFNAGLRLAHRTGADFIWVMDDDVIPASDALEHLVGAYDVLAARGEAPPFVVSTARSSSGLLTNVPEIDRRRNAIAYENWPDLLDRKLAPVTRATFVSMLLPRETLDRHGLPIAAMYIWGEDSEFTLRVTRHRPGYLVGDSRVVHVRQLDGVLDIRRETNRARVALFVHLKRNEVYLKRRYERRRAVAGHVCRQVRLAARLCAEGEFAKAGLVLRGTAWGLVFDPAIEAVVSAPGSVGARPEAHPGRCIPPLPPRADLCPPGGARAGPGVHAGGRGHPPGGAVASQAAGATGRRGWRPSLGGGHRAGMSRTNAGGRSKG